MKKVFLVFGIAAFSSASAQQKDVFDIDRHLQKLAIGKKLPGVNLQNPYILEFKQFPPTHLYTLPNGDKVMTLPRYNMPYIVPGQTYLYFTPNLAEATRPLLLRAYQRKQPGAIPNPADGNIQFR